MFKRHRKSFLRCQTDTVNKQVYTVSPTHGSFFLQRTSSSHRRWAHCLRTACTARPWPLPTHHRHRPPVFGTARPSSVMLARSSAQPHELYGPNLASPCPAHLRPRPAWSSPSRPRLVSGGRDHPNSDRWRQIPVSSVIVRPSRRGLNGLRRPGKTASKTSHIISHGRIIFRV